MMAQQPATSAGGRRLAIVFAVLFVLLSAFAFVWGGIVTAGVRERAIIADRQLRSTAWRMLCAASATGEWPSDLASTATVACDVLPAGEERWPASPDEACPGGLEPWSEGWMVVVSLDPKGVGAPRLSAGGKATGLGTLEAVNGWIEAFHQAHFAGKTAPTAP